MRDLSFDPKYSSQLLGLRIYELVLEKGTVNAVVVADGEVDMTTAPAMAAGLADASRRAAAGNHGCVIADLANVTFMGSVGVRVLQSTRADTRMLRIVAPSRSVRRVMELASATEFVICPTIDTAVRPVRRRL